MLFPYERSRRGSSSNKPFCFDVRKQYTFKIKSVVSVRPMNFELGSRKHKDYKLRANKSCYITKRFCMINILLKLSRLFCLISSHVCLIQIHRFHLSSLTALQQHFVKVVPLLLKYKNLQNSPFHLNTKSSSSSSEQLCSKRPLNYAIVPRAEDQDTKSSHYCHRHLQVPNLPYL